MSLTRQRVIAFKVEGVAGTVESLTAAEAGSRLYNGEVTLNTEFVERDRLGGLGRQASALGVRSTSASFMSYLHGRGSAGTPHHGDLWRACGMALGSQTYTTSDSVSDWRTITVGEFRAGKRRLGRGMMGTATLNFTAGQPVSVDWTFSGGFVEDPTDTPIPAGITYEAASAMPPRWAGSGRLTVDGSTTLLIHKVTINLGNEVVLRESANADGGIVTGLIVDRVVRVTIDPEFVPNATKNWGALFAAGSTFDVTCVVGTAANNTVTVTAAGLQIAQDPSFGDRGGKATAQLEAIGSSLVVAYS